MCKFDFKKLICLENLFFLVEPCCTRVFFKFMFEILLTATVLVAIFPERNSSIIFKIMGSKYGR